MTRTSLHTYIDRLNVSTMKLIDELLTCFARETSLIFVGHTKSRIVYRVEVRLKSDLIVDLGRSDLSHGHLLDGLGI